MYKKMIILLTSLIIEIRMNMQLISNVRMDETIVFIREVTIMKQYVGSTLKMHYEHIW